MEIEERVVSLEDAIKRIEISQAATHQNIDKWMDKVGSNEGKLKAVHKRMDDNQKTLDSMEEVMLTEETMTHILENSFNSHVVGAVKRVFQIGIGVALTAFTAWLVHLLGFKD